MVRGICMGARHAAAAIALAMFAFAAARAGEEGRARSEDQGQGQERLQCDHRGGGLQGQRHLRVGRGADGCQDRQAEAQGLLPHQAQASDEEDRQRAGQEVRPASRFS